MRKTWQAISYLVATGLALTWGSISQAITVNASGVWTNGVLSDGTSPTGVNTNTISWGQPVTGQEQSRYTFNGAGDVEIGDTSILGGQVFELGTFTHHNSIITGTSLNTVNLGFTLTIEGQQSETFDISFIHEETPNSAFDAEDIPEEFDYLEPCPYEGERGIPCPDRVLLPTVNDSQAFSFGNRTYEFRVVGFGQTINGPFDAEFITEEVQDNSSMIFGELRQVMPMSAPPPVSEPATFLASTLILGVGVLAKKRSPKS